MKARELLDQLEKLDEESLELNIYLTTEDFEHVLVEYVEDLPEGSEDKRRGVYLSGD